MDPPERPGCGAPPGGVAPPEARPIRATTSRGNDRLLVRKSYKARAKGSGTIFTGLGLKTGLATGNGGCRIINRSMAPLDLHAGSRAAGPVHDREGSRPMAQPTSANDEAHWRKTTNLMFLHLGIW